MSFAVALGGKGGTGKTTIAGLLIRYMLSHGMKPLLAIDADCNSNLNDVLGVPLAETLSDAREEMKIKCPYRDDQGHIHGDEARTGPDRDPKGSTSSPWAGRKARAAIARQTIFLAA